MEICIGCDKVAHEQPFVAIVPAPDSPVKFIAAPFCLECWSDPTHRLRVIKAHYFPRAAAHVALNAAGSGSIG